jgi:hypothetical protein
VAVGVVVSANSEVALCSRAMKLERQSKRAKLKGENTAALLLTGVEFTSHNSGSHLIIGGFDFWPSTGRWCSRARGQYVKLRKGFGLKGLLDELQKDAV